MSFIRLLLSLCHRSNSGIRTQEALLIDQYKVMPGKKKKKGKNGEKKKKKGGRKAGGGGGGGGGRAKSARYAVDIFNEAAMENAYTTCHNVQDLLRWRGFPWPDAQKKKKKGKK